MSQGKHYSKPEDEACFFIQKSFLQKMVNPHESIVTIIIQGLEPGTGTPSPNRWLGISRAESWTAKPFLRFLLGHRRPVPTPGAQVLVGRWMVEKKPISPTKKTTFCLVRWKGENLHHLYRERFFTQWFYVFFFFLEVFFCTGCSVVILSQNDGILRSKVMMSFRCQPGQTTRVWGFHNHSSGIQTFLELHYLQMFFIGLFLQYC